jgi:hypothetical protein
LEAWEAVNYITDKVWTGSLDVYTPWSLKGPMAVGTTSNFSHFASPAVNLLFNLEAAQQGRSMLFSDEQKLLFKGRKRGFA